MKKLLILAVLAVTSAVVMAQDNSMGYDAGLTGSIDLTYQSKYIWRGFDVFQNDDHAAQLTANLDFFGTGFGMNVVGHRAIGSGHENDERWDYNFYYGNVLLPEDVLQTNYRIGFVHYNFPQRSHNEIDLQELHAIVSMPNLLGVQGLVPSYGLIKWYPANSGTTLGHNASGFLHVGMLDYTFAVPGVTPDVPEQVFKLHSEVVYNDGVSPMPTTTAGVANVATKVDSDWSHAVVGISTDVDLGSGFTMTPGVYYQYSMEKTVNTEDETWFTVGGRYSF
jgi:hypothetical protein